MSKITRSDIIGPTGLGFTQAMFSAIAGTQTAFEELVDAVIADQAAELSDRLGSTAYDLAANLAYVKKTEKNLAAAELIRRRINVILNSINGAGAELSTENERKQREDYLAEAETWIAKIASGTTADGQDFACGALVTSHFGDENA
jgi:hypothetical protein